MITCGRDLTRLHEGLALTAKPDAKGKWSVGIGHDIPAPAPGQPIPQWTEQQADDQFEVDYEHAADQARADVGAVVYDAMCEPRRAVFVDIAFEAGGAGLAQFKTMIACAARDDWDGAAAALVDSLLFRQVRGREEMNAAILKTGRYPIDHE